MKCLRSNFIKSAVCTTVLAITSPLIVSAAGSIDQSCNGATTTSQMIGGGGHIIYQSFKPRYEYLTAISVLLKTDGVGEAKLTVLTKTDHKVLANKTMAEQSDDSRVYLFDFDPVQVTPGQEYLLIVEPTKIENEGISWYYVQNEKGDCYPNGMITSGREDSKVDMRFVTYGYNDESQNLGEVAPEVATDTVSASNDAVTNNVGNQDISRPNNIQDQSSNAVNAEVSLSKEDNAEITKDDFYPPGVKGEMERNRTASKKKYPFFTLAPLIFVLGYIAVRKFKKK